MNTKGQDFFFFLVHYEDNILRWWEDNLKVFYQINTSRGSINSTPFLLKSEVHFRVKPGYID